MKFNVLVTGGLYSTQCAYSAWRFCVAAHESGHKVSQVFFYQDGVNQSTSLSVPLADEFDAVQQWAEYSATSGSELVVCVSAGERRGVVGADQATEFELPSFNLHPAFRVEGLGVLQAASLESDRMVTFK